MWCNYLKYLNAICNKQFYSDCDKITQTRIYKCVYLLIVYQRVGVGKLIGMK